MSSRYDITYGELPGASVRSDALDTSRSHPPRNLSDQSRSVVSLSYCNVTEKNDFQPRIRDIACASGCKDAPSFKNYKEAVRSAMETVLGLEPAERWSAWGQMIARSARDAVQEGLKVHYTRSQATHKKRKTRSKLGDIERETWFNYHSSEPAPHSSLASSLDKRTDEGDIGSGAEVSKCPNPDEQRPSESQTDSTLRESARTRHRASSGQSLYNQYPGYDQALSQRYTPQHKRREPNTDASDCWEDGYTSDPGIHHLWPGFPYGPRETYANQGPGTQRRGFRKGE